MNFIDRSFSNFDSFLRLNKDYETLWIIFCTLQLIMTEKYIYGTWLIASKLQH